MSRIKTLPFVLVLGLLATAAVLGQAQSNFTVIHTFTGPDGSGPYAGPTLDRAGNLYGTTSAGGAGSGLVYRLAHANSAWVLHPLYKLTSVNEGANPYAGVTIGPDNTLFGTAYTQGAGGFGTLFHLTPPPNAVCRAALCPWTDTVLHPFAGGASDGSTPYGNVLFDSHGNLYGTTQYGGASNAGTVYKATRAGGTWNVSVIYTFKFDGVDGHYPMSGLVMDSAGNLYGTTQNGGPVNFGTVFKLSPSGEGWTETVLHSFGSSQGCINDGGYPVGGLVFDRAGNLYGATHGFGYTGCGTIFELSPQESGWNFTTLYTFPENGASANGPKSALAIDSAGNLYGTTPTGGLYGHGNVCELSPTGGGWTYSDLYDFTGGNDGDAPVGGVAVTGPGGHLYGTTMNGGANSAGVIYQIDLGAH